MLGVCCFLAVVLSVDSRMARSAAVSGAAASSINSDLPPMVETSTGELLHNVVSAPIPHAPVAAIADGKPAPRVRTIWMQVTAYCGCKKCCGPNACGITASGRSTVYNGGLFVAADTTLLPFGTQLKIPGYAGDQPVEVIDRGSAIKGNHLDVFFSNHDRALAWGRRWIPVTVVE